MGRRWEIDTIVSGVYHKCTLSWLPLVWQISTSPTLVDPVKKREKVHLEGKFIHNVESFERVLTTRCGKYLTLFPPLLSWLWGPGKGPRAWLWLLGGPGGFRPLLCPRFIDPGTFGPKLWRPCGLWLWLSPWLKGPPGFKPWLWPSRPGLRIPCCWFWRGEAGPLGAEKWRFVGDWVGRGTDGSGGAGDDWPDLADLIKTL